MTLDLWLSLTKTTEAAFAAAIGSTQYSVNRYRRGKRFPRPATILAIEHATKSEVTAGDFLRGVVSAKVP